MLTMLLALMVWSGIAPADREYVRMKEIVG